MMTLVLATLIVSLVALALSIAALMAVGRIYARTETCETDSPARNRAGRATGNYADCGDEDVPG